MARIRTIKPSFWAHEELSALPEATHMLAGALLNYADDHGYFNANIGLVRAACSPLREPSVTIPESLRSLQTVNYIRLGIAPDGKRYGQVVKFDEHQRVSHPTDSKIATLSIVWDDIAKSPEIIAKAPEPFVPEEEGNRREEEGNAGDDSREPIVSRATSIGSHPRFLEVGDRVLTIMGVKDDPRWQGNYSLVGAWLKAGFDPEHDIYPTVERLTMAKRDGPPKSLAYFTDAIAKSKFERDTEIPKFLRDREKSNGKPQHRNGFAAHLADLESEDRNDGGQLRGTVLDHAGGDGVPPGAGEGSGPVIDGDVETLAAE